MLSNVLVFYFIYKIKEPYMEVGNILERKPDILSTIREESILRYSIKNCPEEKLIAVLTTLIENGADVNDTRGENMSPLNTAALWLKHPKNAVKLLLSSGALVNHQDDQVSTFILFFNKTKIK